MCLKKFDFGGLGFDIYRSVEIFPVWAAQSGGVDYFS